MAVAPTFALPKPPRAFIAIEYPGHVAASHTSLANALETMGGISRLSTCLASTSDVPELDLSPRGSRGFDFMHPIQGSAVNTANLVLKIVRRKRKTRASNQSDARVDMQGRLLRDSAGMYTVEVAGVVTRTIRFRSMADFQYQPDAKNDPLVKLAKSLHTLDVQGILDFDFAPPSEDFNKDLNLFPPAVFSRSALPWIYNYKAATSTALQTKFNAHGEEITRLVSNSRYKTTSAVAISFYEDVPAPTEPPSACKQVTTPADLELLGKVKDLLKIRPMWTRLSLGNQLSPEDGRRLTNSVKQLIALSSYTFSDGPFRELVVRFGYDPREEPEARSYQRLMLRVVNPTGARKPIRQGTVRPDDETLSRSSHIFDGRASYREIGNFQLCDISDPLLRQLLDNPQWQVDVCNSRAGWFLPNFLEGFREILRFKFVNLLQGTIVSDVDCADAVYRLPDDRAILEERKALKQEAASRPRIATSAEPRLNHGKRTTALDKPDVRDSTKGRKTTIAKYSTKPKAKRRDEDMIVDEND